MAAATATAAAAAPPSRSPHKHELVALLDKGNSCAICQYKDGNVEYEWRYCHTCMATYRSYYFECAACFAESERLAAAEAAARTAAERVRVATASSAERAEAEARFAAASAAAAAAGAPAPFRGPAADSALGELFINALPIICAHAHGLELHHARYICGVTLREGARRSDGRLDRTGFPGGPADMIKQATLRHAPWLAEARARRRKYSEYNLFTTQLMRSAGAGDEQHVRELLAAGAAVTSIDAQNRAALHHACENNRLGVVSALLEADAAGATLDLRDKDESTPLMATSNESIVKLLLARGARVELQDRCGSTVLHLVVGHRFYSDILPLLCAAPGAATALRLRDGKLCTPHGVAALHDAEQRSIYGDKGYTGREATLHALALGVQLRAVLRSSAAERAAFDARAAADEAALGPAAGADAPRRRLGELLLRVLPVAFAAGHALDLIRARHVCSATLRSGASPADAMAAALRLQAPWLAEARARKAENADFFESSHVRHTTQLMRAADAGDVQRVRELMAAGATLHHVDAFNRNNALHWACFAGHEDVVLALLQGYKNAGAANQVEEEEEEEEAVAAAAVVSPGAAPSIDARNFHHVTALMAASYSDNHGIVRALLRHGARQELQKMWGSTALHIASRWGCARVAAELCAAPGAAAALEMLGDGRTPLDFAVEHGFADVEAVLRAHGAKETRGPGKSGAKE